MSLKLQVLTFICFLFGCHVKGYTQIATYNGKISNLNIKSSFQADKSILPDISVKDTSAIKAQIARELETYLTQEINKLEAAEHTRELEKTFSGIYGSISDLKNYDDKVLSYFPDSSLIRMDTAELVNRLEEVAIQQLSQNKDIRSANELLSQKESEFDQLKSNFEDPSKNLDGFVENPSKWMEALPEGAMDGLLDVVRNKSKKQKQKFSSYSSDETVSNVKSNSLKGAPLRKRFLFECDFQTQIDKETSLDLLPTVGWRINKGWSFGAGISYRFFLSADQNSIYTDQEVKGYRILSDYNIWKSLFIRGEFESLNVSREGDRGSEVYWSDSASIGAGNTFSFSDKIKGKLIIQYNLLHTESSPSRRPFVIRFGLSI